jgi:hypothetical protein
MASVSDIFINFFFNKKNIDKGIKEIKRDFDGLSSEISKGIFKGIGVIAGINTVTQGFKKLLDTTNLIGDTAKRFNMPVESISRFNNLMSLVGANTSEAMDSFSHFKTAIVDFKTTGGGLIADMSKDFAINMSSVKDVDDLLLSLRERYQSLQNTDQKTKFLSKFNKEQVSLITATTEAFDGYIKKANNMNTINDDAIKGANDFRVALAELRNEGMVLGTKLMPVMTGFARALTHIPEILTAIGGGLADVIGAVKDTSKFFGKGIMKTFGYEVEDEDMLDMDIKKVNKKMNAIRAKKKVNDAWKQNLPQFNNGLLNNGMLPPVSNTSTRQSTVTDNSTITINVNGAMSPRETGQEIRQQLQTRKLSNRGVQVM